MGESDKAQQSGNEHYIVIPKVSIIIGLHIWIDWWDKSPLRPPPNNPCHTGPIHCRCDFRKRVTATTTSEDDYRHEGAGSSGTHRAQPRAVVHLHNHLGCSHGGSANHLRGLGPEKEEKENARYYPNLCRRAAMSSPLPRFRSALLYSLSIGPAFICI